MTPIARIAALSKASMSRRKPDYDDQVYELISKADGLPEGPAKVAIFEEAVALADLHQDVELAFDTRMEMLWPAYHASRQDLLLVHFAWCLAKLDENDDLDPHGALWAYRWVLDSMPGFPDIPRPQIEAAIADMIRRYSEHGASLRPCYHLHRRVYLDLGDRAAARTAHKKIAGTKRDWFSDDLETEKAFAVFYAVLQEEYAKAVRLGEKFLSDPSISTHFRGLIMSELILPSARLGHWERAAEYQTISMPLLKKERQGAGNFAEHAEYLAVVGNLAAAVKVYERHLESAAVEPNRIMRFDYYRAGKFLCERLLATGKSKVKFRVPDSVEIPASEAGRVPCEAFATWLDAQIAELVQRLDARNGTTFYAEELAKLGESVELAERYARLQPPKVSTRTRRNP
jgi:hypothetical protein